MNILPEIQQKVQNEILPNVPLKLRPMFELGVNGLSLTPFSSLNSNARTARRNSKAAMMQMYRLTINKKIIRIFLGLVKKRFKINKKSIVSIDFTIFDPFAVLCFALQTRNGRSIPLWVDILKYPITSVKGKEKSQNIFILKNLKEFIKLLGFKPKIVCDRGFIGNHLIKGFIKLKLNFAVRMKAGKKVEYRGKKYLIKKKLKDLYWLDITGSLYGEEVGSLRIVRSSKTMKRRAKAKECWYIVTNDFKAEREQILKDYYYRFEIEETFKDLKHLFDTKPRYFKKKLTLKILLWFQILGMWLLWEISQVPRLVKLRLALHKKKAISWVKQTFELLLNERTKPIIPIQACRKEVAVL